MMIWKVFAGHLLTVSSVICQNKFLIRLHEVINIRLRLRWGGGGGVGGGGGGDVGEIRLLFVAEGA